MQTECLTGTIHPIVQIRGSLSPAINLTGHVCMPDGYDIYSGDYNIIPETFSQTIESKNKVMKNDVTIAGIPFYEVSNTEGGTTCIIGGKLNG